ncbi:hypothetical protein TrST_g13693 [Triparma strigata]|uniref:Uncharacterized protein n=1 Tax=Triparma strigata TaxID=1606541 RepID=A0A9W7BN17_9STRA|nr:hypothetical protein TrST_g13693 [Triparma strigata]
MKGSGLQIDLICIQCELKLGRAPNRHGPFFYRRATDAGKALPYFYDIELKPSGDYVNKNGLAGCFAVGTWHGKPGLYMWRNYLWTFDSMEEARKKRRFVPPRAAGGGGEGGEEEAPQKKKQKTAR